MKVGVISDTHGLLRPEALNALHGSDMILHAGDVGKGNVLERLELIAPVIAIRGNIDKSGKTASLPDAEAIELQGRCIYMIHNVKELDLEPAGQFAAVISGHSHRPRNETIDGVLYFNPGSAGPRRFKLPVTVGELSIEADSMVGTIVGLDV